VIGPVAAALLGTFVVLITFSSVLRTLVVPRGLRSMRVRLVLVTILGIFRFVARRLSGYPRRDAVLALAAPISTIATLVMWLLCFLFGFTLLLWAIEPIDWSAAFREAGSSLFTLGFASTDRAQLTVVDFMAAATGPIVIGLLVGYLPSLYSAYNRREVEVALLHSRSGEPNWGPEILARHAFVNTVSEIDVLFRSWERWAADVSESHVNYPVLIHIRSAAPWRNWLIACLSIMDAAAMHLALNPSLPQGPSRIALRQCFVMVREVARADGITFVSDPDPEQPISLSYNDFEQVCAYLATAGYPMERSPQEAWPHFCGWRVNYEEPIYLLAKQIDAPPALWSGDRYGDLTATEPSRPVNRMPGGRVGRPRPGE